MCPRCGRQVGATPALVNERPSSVRLAAILLLISWGLGLLSFSILFQSASLTARLPAFYFLRTAGFSVIGIVLIVCIWLRQVWARIAMVLFVGWGILTLLIAMQRISGSAMAMAGLAVPLLVAALRLGGIYFLFKPDSNAWFSKR
jgi:uncharacterized paraquat-inducible protein A